MRNKVMITIWAVCGAIIAIGLAVLLWTHFRWGGAQSAPLNIRPSPDVQETLPAELTEADKVRAITFVDVSADSPYHDAICYAAHRGYLLRVEDNYFDPDGLITSQMSATVLERVAGSDKFIWEFSDTEELLSRQLLAAILQVAAMQLGLDITTTESIESYSDKYMVVSEAYDIMSWAMEKGLFDGIVTGKLHPELAVSRAQLAQSLLALDALRPEGDLARELLGTPAPAEAVTMDEKTLADLQAAVDSSVKRNRAVGAQVAIIKDGDVIATLNSGWATKNVDDMSDENKMRIASISKTVVGMGAMALAEVGTVRLDSPVGAYWGASFENPMYPKDAVTLRSILNHTSSIRPPGTMCPGPAPM